jgi:hypothetical protein
VIPENKNMTTLRSTELITPPPLRHGLFLITLMLACSAILPGPKAFAVSPAPDGGYPGNNTAEGTSALLNLTSGISNTAIGFAALVNTTGNYNTANGANAVRHNRSGAQNTGTGSRALEGTSSGS